VTAISVLSPTRIAIGFTVTFLQIGSTTGGVNGAVALAVAEARLLPRSTSGSEPATTAVFGSVPAFVVLTTSAILACAPATMSPSVQVSFAAATVHVPVLAFADT
jgi:hypothetical protein